jgi:hypothetical protein
MPGVLETQLDDDEVTLGYSGSEEEACDLLAELIRRGLRISEFRQQHVNLEQVFMDVTTGGVQ